MTKTGDKVFEVALDEEEQELLDSIEQGEWKSVKQLDQKKALFKKSADHYLKKDSRVNIRISSNDLDRLKQKAAFKGIPYQTFIAGILHEVAAGHFSS